MVVFFAGLVDHTDEAVSGMQKFFFARGIESLQDGFVTFSDGVPRDGGWIILLIGTLFAAYVMFAWWKDVAAESKAGDHTPVVDIGLRYGMIMFIMQEAMFFVGWFWMFFELGLFHKMRAAWNTDILPNAAEYADTMAPGIHAINPWNLPLMNTVVEYLEAYLHRADGEPWLSTDAYGSAFFMATGFHGLHVLIGTIFLAVMYMRLMKGGLRPSGSSSLPLSISSLALIYMASPRG